jgi:L-lysine exporter family protein LysE/ArgO
MFMALGAGFLTGLSLIAAIGAQNAFVLRQGLRREFVGMVVLTCALSDALLIVAGVAGFGAVSARLPWLVPVMLWGGVLFLLAYGALRFRSAWRGGGALLAANAGPASRRRVLAICLLMTWANPHVYLDTLALIGAISVGYGALAWVFGLGAVVASFVFFASLGYGARLLQPLFANPRAWVVLEIGIGVVMWAIAAGLVRQALSGGLG